MRSWPTFWQGPFNIQIALVSLGHFETLDALAAIEYAHFKTAGLPLGLIGYSMGHRLR